MYICYVDESSGSEAPNQARGATPLMTFAGLIIRTDALAPLTADFLDLKRRFLPGTTDGVEPRSRSQRSEGIRAPQASPLTDQGETTPLHHVARYPVARRGGSSPQVEDCFARERVLREIVDSHLLL